MYYNPVKNVNPEEILIYLRKSRADDPMLSVEEVLSKHETLLDEWVEKNLPIPIPAENRFKEVVSGESIADRPEFQKVLKLIESPKYRAVLVVEVSRLGRPDMEEIGRLSKIFRYTNTIVITPMMTFDITNEYERDMFERELKRGNEYLEYTKKLLSRGRELSVKSGNYVCSKPVFGYDKITIMDGKKKCPTLAVNEEEANIVRMIFNWYVNENIGTQTIANRLNEMGLVPPQAEVRTPDSIRKVLENPTYIGKVRWNTRKGVHVVEDGKIRKTRPVNKGEDYILCDGKHEAIISEEIFQAAQEKRGKSHRTCDNKELRNPLASLLYCECGRAMSYRHSTRGELKYRNDPRLVCNGQKYCHNGSCSVPEIVAFVAEVLEQKIAEFEIELTKANHEDDTLREKLIKSLEKKLEDINAKELSMWESQMNPEVGTRMPPHIFQALTEKLTKEREEVEAGLRKAQESISTPVDYERKISTFQKALDALLDDKKSAAEKNHLLKHCINKITYHRDAPERILGKGNGRGYTSPPIKLDINLKV